MPDFGASPYLIPVDHVPEFGDSPPVQLVAGGDLMGQLGQMGGVATPSKPVSPRDLMSRGPFKPVDLDSYFDYSGGLLDAPSGPQSDWRTIGRQLMPAVRRQQGGPLDQGQAALVGENGPEVFVPDRPGTIVPTARQSAPYLVPVDHVPEFGDVPVLRAGSIGAPERAPGESAGGIALDLLSQIPGAVRGALSLPQRAFGASENMRTGGPYDPGPAVEASMLTMGATPMGVARGAGEAALGAGPIRPSDFFKARETPVPANSSWVLPPPKPFMDRLWDNYIKHMSPDEMLQSEPLWGGARQLAQDTGTRESEAFAQIANEMYGRMGANKFMTPEAARKYMGQERGIGTVIGSGPTDSKAAGAAMMAAPQGIRAYHGSPYDFDKFDMSKIGTGEGAQAYGHGLYFAENPAVAAEYKNNLSPGRAASLTESGKQEFKSRLDDAYSEAAVAHGVSKNEIAEIDGPTGSLRQSVLNQMSEHGDADKWFGRSYEVSINADPEHFLDWDKPLSEQPKAAQELNRYSIAQTGNNTWEVRHPGGWVPNAAKNFYRSEGAAQKAADDLNSSRTAADLAPRSPEDMQRLRDAGIPGIKYLDQGSRALPQQVEHLKGQVSQLEDMLAQTSKNDPRYASIENALAGRRNELAQAQSGATRNYVLFRDDIIDILRKYGLAGLSALPPAVAASVHKKMFQPVDHDPFQ